MVNAKSVGKGFFKYVDEFVTEETYDAWMHRGFGIQVIFCLLLKDIHSEILV